MIAILQRHYYDLTGNNLVCFLTTFMLFLRFFHKCNDVIKGSLFFGNALTYTFRSWKCHQLLFTVWINVFLVLALPTYISIFTSLSPFTVVLFGFQWVKLFPWLYRFTDSSNYKPVRSYFICSLKNLTFKLLFSSLRCLFWASNLTALATCWIVYVEVFLTHLFGSVSLRSYFIRIKFLFENAWLLVRKRLYCQLSKRFARVGG
jgi:hypothetical protein